MLVRHPAGLKRESVCVIVIALCFCVMMQMLGAPVTLLSAADISDELAGSVLEGFSVPPARPRLAVFSVFTLVAESHPFVDVLAFATMPFHPPVR